MSSRVRRSIHHKRRRKAAEVFRELGLNGGDVITSDEWKGDRKVLSFDGVQVLLSTPQGMTFVSSFPPDVAKKSP